MITTILLGIAITSVAIGQLFLSRAIKRTHSRLDIHADFLNVLQRADVKRRLSELSSRNDRTEARATTAHQRVTALLDYLELVTTFTPERTTGANFTVHPKSKPQHVSLTLAPDQSPLTMTDVRNDRLRSMYNVGGQDKDNAPG